MKKIFMFLAVVGFTVFGVSCGSDDNIGGNLQGGQKTLTLKTVTENAKVGDKVSFQVTLRDAVVAGIGLYIDNKKVTNPYTFDQVGEFNVVAKKKGFSDSNVVKIKVTDGEASLIEPVLFLTAIPGASEIGVGQELTFVFSDAKGDIVDNVQLLKDDVVIDGDKYVVTADDAGKNIKLTGIKGELTSNELVYSVTALPSVPETNFVRVGTSWIDLKSVALYFYRDPESKRISKILHEGKEYTLFRATAFTGEVNGTIPAVFHDNSVSYGFAVEVKEDGSFRYPWQVDDPMQILILELFGSINGEYFEVDDATFYNPYFKVPDENVIGNVVLNVQNGTDEVSKLDFELKFDGYYEGFYEIDRPLASEEASSKRYAKYVNLAKGAEDLQIKNLEQIRIY